MNRGFLLHLVAPNLNLPRCHDTPAASTMASNKRIFSLGHFPSPLDGLLIFLCSFILSPSFPKVEARRGIERMLNVLHVLLD